MLDVSTQSYINLFGVLAALEDLCRIDEQARAIVADQDASVTFSVHGGPRGTLHFCDGRCRMSQGTSDGRIRLFLSSPEAFNRMMEGKANPLPYRGFTHLRFMTGPFARLSKRLEYFLRADAAQLQDPVFRDIYTELVMHVAAGAVAQVAAHDPELAQWAASLPEGVVAFEVRNGPALHLVKSAGTLSMHRGPAQVPRASMCFADLETAYGVLTGKSDSFSAIASERLVLAGFIPMLDALDKLLLRASRYLK